MSFEIFKTYPPDRESAVAELTVTHGDTTEIPAEVFREDGVLTIRIFPRAEGGVWQYGLHEWLDAIDRAAQVLDSDA